MRMKMSRMMSEKDKKDHVPRMLQDSEEVNKVMEEVNKVMEEVNMGIVADMGQASSKGTTGEANKGTDIKAKQNGKVLATWKFGFCIFHENPTEWDNDVLYC